MRPDPVLVYGHDETVAAWVSRELSPWGHSGFAEGAGGIGILDRTGRVLAGVVYHDYSRSCRTMSMTIAGRSPMFATKATIRALLAYPFITHDCFKVWVTTHQTNIKAIKFLHRVGFRGPIPLRHHFGPKKHAAFFDMTQPEFLKLYGSN